MTGVAVVALIAFGVLLVVILVLAMSGSKDDDPSATRRGGPITLAMIDGLPKRGRFTYAGVEYTIRALHLRPAHEVYPTRYQGNNYVVLEFDAGEGVKVEVYGRSVYNTRLDRRWGVGDHYYEEPASELRIEVRLDGLPVATDIFDTARITDERLRACVDDARQALIAYAESMRAAAYAEETQQRALQQQAERDLEGQVEERLNRL